MNDVHCTTLLNVSEFLYHNGWPAYLVCRGISTNSKSMLLKTNRLITKYNLTSLTKNRKQFQSRSCSMVGLVTTEADVGITKYLNTKNPGFKGRLKVKLRNNLHIQEGDAQRYRSLYFNYEILN